MIFEKKKSKKYIYLNEELVYLFIYLQYLQLLN